MQAKRTAAAGVLCALLAACQATTPPGVDAGPTSAPSAATAEPAAGAASAAGSASGTASPAASPAPTPSATPSATRRARPLAERTIVIDPGHNGIWTRKLLRLVPSGNGRTKACNSTGTATNAGYPEHAFTWAQANALAKELRARGATVRLTRPDDHSQGPCVNLRSKLANELDADALVSLHADGSFARGARGFHVITSPTMAGGSGVERRSVALARAVRHALEASTAMPRSTYIGRGTGLDSRTDLGTLNLSERPAVMLELGNMRSRTDAALLTSKAFRGTVADAIADALADWLS